MAGVAVLLPYDTGHISICVAGELTQPPPTTIMMKTKQKTCVQSADLPLKKANRRVMGTESRRSSVKGGLTTSPVCSDIAQTKIENPMAGSSEMKEPIVAVLAIEGPPQENGRGGEDYQKRLDNQAFRGRAAFKEDVMLRLAAKSGWLGPTLSDVERTAVRLPQLASRHGLDKQEDYCKITIDTFHEAISHTVPAVPLRYRLLVYARAAPTWVQRLVIAGGLALSGLVVYTTGIVKRPVLYAGSVFTGFAIFGYYRRRTQLVVSLDPKILDFCTEGCVKPPPTHSGKLNKLGDMTKCQPRTYLVAFTIAEELVWIPRKCCHNELTALLHRQLLPALSTPELRSEACKQAFKNFTKFFHYSEIMPTFDTYSTQECNAMYAAHLPPPRRKTFQDIKSRPHDYQDPDGKVTEGFVKVEVLLGKIASKRHPRFISGKTNEYLAAVGPTFYRFQKWLDEFMWAGKSLDTLINRKFIYPGSIPPDKLGALVSHYEHMGWHFYEGDFSRLDGHTEEELLVLELELYYSLGLPTWVLDLLGQQLTTKGHTKCAGHKFTVDGKRASGAINTTYGNTLLCMAMAAGAMEDCGCIDYVVIQLGDDNVIITKEPISEEIYLGFMTKIGHKLDMVYRGWGQDAVDNLEFCSQLFWDTGESRIMGPKPFRALAKSFVPHNVLTSKALMQHAAGVAEGYKHYGFIPILRVVCKQLILAHVPKLKIHDSNPYRRMLNHFVDVDTHSIDTHFLRRYGFEPYELEKIMEQLDYSRPMSVTHPLLREGLTLDGVWDEDILAVDVLSLDY